MIGMATGTNRTLRSDSAAVLIVDDTPANLLALGAVLSPLGVRTVAAQSAKEALSHISNEPFAVALVDVQMPGMDGFELTRHLRKLEYGRELPVLFVTAIHRDEEYARKGYASGAADYITKPYDPNVVRARVKAFVDLFEQREAVRRGQVALRTQERDEAIRRLVAFERIASAALETQDLQALLHELLLAFTGAADVADSATILLRNGDWLEVKASVGLEEELTAGYRLRVGQGFSGRIASERHPIELSDATRSDVVDSPWVRSRGIRGLYGMPLLHGGEVLGVAHIGSTRAGSFSDGEKRLFRAAADKAALAVGRHFELSRLYEILGSAPAFIAIVRAPSGEYTFANPAYRALFRSECAGKTLRDVGFGADAIRAVDDVHTSGRAIHVSELEVPVGTADRAQVSALYVSFTAQPLVNPAGTVDRVLIFAVDVTSQVLARQEIEATQASRAALLERERAARRAAEVASISKDEFLATVSHELRTPLNAILGWASMARARAVPDIDRALTVIERNALAQARIVEDVLDFSRIARGKMRLSLVTVDMELVVREALETVKPAAEAKAVELDIRMSVQRKLQGDSERLQQVVWNLLTNAIKFTAAGGCVRVRVSEGAGKVRLVVSDTGQGIEPEFVPYVFDPFRQADGGTTRRHGGLGLGLAIVKQIVQAHGGTIAASSDGLGRGASFVVELPLDSKPELSPDSTSLRTPVNRHLGGLKVMVVDDDDDSREFLVSALGQRGATVASMASAGDAIDAFETFRPDVLVSDIAMPDADGYDLIRYVRRLPNERGGGIPAVAVTAHARQQDHELARAAGFHRLEPKPVDVEHLTMTLATLGGLTSFSEESESISEHDLRSPR